MAEPYLGQLSLFPFSFAPKGYAFCNGQILPISQNTALFSLLGTTYGGNGVQTFALPNLQGSVAISPGNGFVLGQTTGTESVTLSAAQMPAHTHTLTVSNSTGPLLSSLAGNTVGITASNNYAGSSNVAMDPGSITNSGGSQAHENRSPYLVLNWVIALTGIFPSRN